MKFYLLDENKNPYEVPLEKSYAVYEDANMKITKQDWVNNVFVSTVFLGMDHRLSNDDGPPLLWETMIFGGEHADYQERYTSHKDALEGHQRALNLVNPMIK